MSAELTELFIVYVRAGVLTFVIGTVLFSVFSDKYLSDFEYITICTQWLIVSAFWIITIPIALFSAVILIIVIVISKVVRLIAEKVRK